MVQWTVAYRTKSELVRTLIKWYDDPEPDLLAFVNNNDDVIIPYGTLKKYVSLDPARRQKIPQYLGGNRSLITQDQLDLVITECVVGSKTFSTHEIADKIMAATNEKHELTKKQARRLASGIVEPEVKSILDKPFSSDFSRMLYFQETHDKEHGLRRHLPGEVKSRHNGHYGVWSCVASEIVVAISLLGLYIVKDLHETPHGDKEVSAIPLIEERARHSNVALIKFPQALQRGITPNVQVFREASPEMLHPSVINFPKATFYEYVKLAVKPTVDIRHQVSSRVIDMGFSQPQPRSPDLRTYMGVNLPHWKESGGKFLLNMPASLRNSFGDLIVHVQNVLRFTHCDSMMDTLRTALFEPIWREFGFSSHSILFEYVNVIVKPENGNTLNNHMDHMNDKRVGYNYSPVFWYLHEDEGIKYRVTIVMTFRLHCGKTETVSNVKEL